MPPDPQETAYSATITEEILNGKYFFVVISGLKIHEKLVRGKLKSCFVSINLRRFFRFRAKMWQISLFLNVFSRVGLNPGEWGLIHG